MKNVKLPDLPSELIRVALADLEKVESSDQYRVDMRRWHVPDGDVCSVCLAGAVMAKTIELSPERYGSPNIMGMLIANGLGDPADSCLYGKLHALDEFRSGDVEGAFSLMELEGAPPFTVADIPEYNPDDPAPFKKDMLELASDLEKAGF